MAYDQYLAERIGHYFNAKGLEVDEKRMMGGLAFMLDGKMCVGVNKNLLMARVGPDHYADCLAQPACREMDFTGRPMKGYVFVSPDGLDTDTQLEFFLDRAVDFNPMAKASRKRK